MAGNGKRIAALDNSEQFNRGRMPLPTDLSTPTEPWIHDEHHLGRKRVFIDDLVATQDRYNPAKVKGMKPGSGRPTVVVTDEGVLIHDGHHRVLKAKAEGQRSLWVDAYDGRRS